MYHRHINRYYQNKYEHEYILHYGLNAEFKDGFCKTNNFNILDSLDYMNRADIEVSYIKHPLLYIIIYNPNTKKYINYFHNNNYCLGFVNHIYHTNGIKDILYNAAINTFETYYNVPIKNIKLLGTYYDAETSFSHVLHIIQIDCNLIKNQSYYTLQDMTRNILNYDTVSKNIIATII